MIETKELNGQAEIVDKSEDSADLIKRYEEIICVKRKAITSVAHHQGKVFSWFREKEKFVRLVANFGVHKGTLIFKINIIKLLDKYSKCCKIFKAYLSVNFVLTYFS